MFGSIGSALTAAFSVLADWRRREIARAELESLDDRTLADIGITRGDIESIVAGRFRRDEPLRAPTPRRPANVNAGARSAA